MNRETGSRDVVANKFFRCASKTDGISGDPSDLSGFFPEGRPGFEDEWDEGLRLAVPLRLRMNCMHLSGKVRGFIFAKG